MVIARHGDRAPIARNIGKAIQDTQEIEAFWRSKLPAEEEIRQWTKAYPPAKTLTPLDLGEAPYAQVCVGTHQVRV